MKRNNLNNFFKGWFIGKFEPSLFQTDDFEIAVKRYKKGDYEESHVHKIATEYTLIISGFVDMNGSIWQDNDIIIIKPGEYTDFTCLTDVITCVVKTPSSKNDKYIK